ncbi:SGNH/GDSL hydrolase family protein [Aquimarina pacifica]|uniref:lipase n=1 Tax=Aquimarina pacifica TaxID=1296415 RepID=UPI0004B3FC69|nr:lipase [Aquimarina pacifica]
MNIKPIQISVFILLVLGGLFGLMFLSQEDGVQKEQTQDDGFSYKEIAIKYPTYATFLGLKKDSTLKREDVLEVTQIVTPLDIETTEDKSDIELTKEIQKLPDFSKIDTTQIVRIKYPEDNPDFVNELRDKLSSRSCRIIHYGDSQIEGDRITGYLRNRLQHMFGGSGPGFIPVLPVYRQISAIVEPSEHWERYAFFDPTKKKFSHRKYGSYLSTSRFTKYQKVQPDSIAIDTLPIVKATVKIGKSKKTYAKFRRFSKIGLHYGNCNFPIRISVFNDNILIQQDSLITDGQYHQYQINTSVTPTDLRIELEGKISADFYGFTLDSGSGVQIDNVAMRGASGTIFANSSAQTYAQMMKKLSPKIVIMQYGGNTMPYLKDSTDVEKYTKRMSNQINWIRKRTKNISFIFIGPTDMCLPVNGKMETYPMLPYLNQRLIETCMQNNVAYWSMYDAMGGKGSMKLWVDEKLTAKDYMHFTWKGTKIISELLFTSLYLDLKEPKTNDET